MTTSTAQRRISQPLRIHYRPTDEDRKNFLIGCKPTRITAVRIGPIRRYDIELDDRGEHFTTDCIIQCRQGLVNYSPVIFRCSTNHHYSSVSGSHKLPRYCREQLSRALLNRVATFLCNEAAA